MFGRPPELERRAGVPAARTVGVEVGFLVAAAGGVIGVDAARAPAGVVAREQRHDDEALHRQRQVLAHEPAEQVGLALEAQRDAFALLVVLELELEDADQLEAESCGPGDRHPGVAVRRVQLLHVALRDRAAGRCPPVGGHDDAFVEGDGRDRRAVPVELGRRPRVVDAGTAANGSAPIDFR